MTVILLFHGGPRDGGWRRVSSETLERGKHIVIDVRRHMYCSYLLWQMEERVDIFYQGKRVKGEKEAV